MNTIEKLNENQSRPVYIKNVFGKNINGMLGAVVRGNMRGIFGQASKNGSYFQVGSVNINTGEIEKMSDENYRDAQKIIEML